MCVYFSVLYAAGFGDSGLLDLDLALLSRFIVIMAKDLNYFVQSLWSFSSVFDPFQTNRKLASHRFNP